MRFLDLCEKEYVNINHSKLDCVSEEKDKDDFELSL